MLCGHYIEKVEEERNKKGEKVKERGDRWDQLTNLHQSASTLAKSDVKRKAQPTDIELQIQNSNIQY